ncbi:DUF1254 domain-containing protein [Nocardia sp. NPDC050712]|uniref:DUF1254 domain-containing protein n=1 Tax=Nocardia sp. NPDC050712 TaxID=3155518 RepID=UPI0033FBF2C1
MEASDNPFGHRLSRRWVLGTAALGGFGLAACGSNDQSSSSRPAPASDDSEDPKDIAADAYTFGYPLVLMDATRIAAGAPNQFANAVALPDPDERLVVRLNLDTLYSQAWLALAAEPLVLQVPAVEPDRYWLMQLLDAWSNTRHNPSSVHAQVRPGVTTPPYTYLVTGPQWQGEVPEGMTQLAMPTETAWILGRIEVKDSHDVAKVLGLQNELKLVPLSAWLRGETASTGRPYAPTPGAIPPPKQVAALDGPDFFDRMCALMAANPPAAEDAPALRRFATLGIAPGATVDLAITDVLDAGVAQAKTRIPEYDDPGTKDENGWVVATDLGAYGTNYALRARTAMQGLGANLAEDAIYPTIYAKADSNGKPLRYRMRFPAGRLPPVDAFWSLTAYDTDNYLVPNTAGIYAIGHEIPVVPGADGSVDLAVQCADPGSAVPRGNWLPIPASGQFSLSLRLYEPRPEAIDGTWQIPALTQVT